MRLANPLVEFGGEEGELSAVIAALSFPGIVEDEGSGGPGCGCSGCQDVGEVDLALGVVLTHLEESLGEECPVEGVDPGVDFGDEALSLGGVLLFDDRGDDPGLVAHDPPITRRISGDGGEDRDGVSFVLVKGDEAGESAWGKHGDITGGDDDGTFEGTMGLDHGVERAQNRSAGAGDFILVGNEGLRGDACHFCGDNISLMADHGDKVVGVKGLGCSERMAEHGQACNRMHDLWKIGFHAGSLTRCEDDNGCRNSHGFCLPRAGHSTRYLAPPPGLEPGPKAPKTHVLPLHQGGNYP